MSFSAALAIIASFVAASQASPIEVQERSISARVTLCNEPNMQDCDTTYIPVNTCCEENESPNRQHWKFTGR